MTDVPPPIIDQVKRRFVVVCSTCREISLARVGWWPANALLEADIHSSSNSEDQPFVVEPGSLQ